MHESSLLRGLMRQIETVARECGASRVDTVHLRVGVLSGLSPEHLRDHFAHAAEGTVAEGARVVVRASDDLEDAHAQGVLLESVDIEE